MCQRGAAPTLNIRWPFPARGRYRQEMVSGLAAPHEEWTASSHETDTPALRACRGRARTI